MFYLVDKGQVDVLPSRKRTGGCFTLSIKDRWMFYLVGKGQVDVLPGR